MKKVMKIMSIVLLFGLILISSSCKNNIEEQTDAMRFKEEYESLNASVSTSSGKTYRTVSIDENNPIVYKSAEELVEMIKSDETFVVYFGFKSCPWCRSIIETMLSVSNDLNIGTIYYVDVLDIRDTLSLDENDEVITSKNGTDAYYELLELLDNVLDDYTLTNSKDKEVKTGEKRIYAPNVIAIKDGEAVSITEGVSDKQTDGYEELTDEMKTDMYNNLECTMKCILNTDNVCSKEKC